MKQDGAIGMFLALAKETQNAKPGPERQQIFQRELSRIEFSEEFSLPIEPTLQLKRVLPTKCSFFDSKTVRTFLDISHWLGASIFGV